MYKIVPSAAGGGQQDLEVHRVQTRFGARITEKENSLIITPIDKVLPTTIDKPVKTFSAGANYETNHHFPDANHDVGMVPNKFVYTDHKFLLQGLSIPLKIRPALKDRSLKDSFPSQVETGLNVGLAFGVKFSRNIYRSEKNMFGQSTNRVSISSGFFMGTGGADLKKANTRDPIIQYERKVPMLNPGFFLMLGFNNVNFGYAAGVDYALGRDRKSWLYQGKFWHGISIGLDIIK